MIDRQREVVRCSQKTQSCDSFRTNSESAWLTHRSLVEATTSPQLQTTTQEYFSETCVLNPLYAAFHAYCMLPSEEMLVYKPSNMMLLFF